jgi:ABC-type amino acid transport substrate-binding protein
MMGTTQPGSAMMPARWKTHFGLRAAAILALLAGQLAPAFAESRYDKILAGKRIVVGAQEGTAPFGYVDDKGEVAGWAVDLSRLLNAVIEKKMGEKLELEFRRVTPETRIPLIVNGSLDWVLGSTGISVERLEVVDFSLINNAVCTQMLNRKDVRFASYQDLAGKRVGVTNGSVEQKVLTEMGANGQINPPPKIIAFPTHAVGFLALEQGRTDVHVTLDVALRGLAVAAKSPDEWSVHGPDLFCIPSGIILPQNDSKWTRTVNNALCTLIANGDFDKLYDEWFGPNRPKAGFPLPMSPTTYTVIHNECPYGIENWLPKK